MFITVLICTTNRAASLKQTLESIFSPQNLAETDWEAMVIAKPCPDDTNSVGRDFANRFPKHFRYLEENRPGKSRAMNLGIGAARGEILAMTDDDVICAPNYIAAIRRTFQQHTVDGIQGRIFLDCVGGLPNWVGPELAAHLGLRDYGDTILEWNDNLAGTNMVVLAAAARKVGGYDPDLGAGTPVGFAEDSDFSSRIRKAGGRFLYAPEVWVRHQLPRERVSKAFFRERYFRSGRSRARLERMLVPTWRYALFALRRLLFASISSTRHRLMGRSAEALLVECHALAIAGFFWQHLITRFSPTQKPTQVAQVHKQKPSN